MSVPICTVISLWSRFLSPEWIIPKQNPAIYLNVNQAWSMWRDAAKHFKTLDFIKSSKYNTYITLS